jgi:alkanesulfonate monooxygenase
MTIQTYWQLDVAEDPRVRNHACSASAALFRDVRTPALNRYDYYAQVAQAAAQTAFDGLFLRHTAR